MAISNEDYAAMVQKAAPPSPLALDCLKAFLAGGFVCCFAQGVTEALVALRLAREDAKLLAMMTLIVLTAVLTAAGVFDRLAKHAGAGLAVPITGFANSVVSPALEFKSEGYILGTAAQMFSIAGPVIVFGCSSAAIYGLIYYFLTKGG